MHSFENIEQVKSNIFNINNDAEFENLALELFHYQMENNPVYAPYASLILKGKRQIISLKYHFSPLNSLKKSK